MKRFRKKVNLHPKWQQRILGLLKEIFPKVQFIITTHSPMVVSTTEENEAIELFMEDNRIKYNSVGNPQEWYMSDILRNVFNISEKVSTAENKKVNETLEDKLKRYSELVKKYASSRDKELKDEVNSLYKEILPSLPEGNPRRRVLDRLKELAE